eukprot:tig00000342_g24234.t1
MAGTGESWMSGLTVSGRITPQIQGADAAAFEAPPSAAADGEGGKMTRNFSNMYFSSYGQDEEEAAAQVARVESLAALAGMKKKKEKRVRMRIPTELKQYLPKVRREVLDTNTDDWVVDPSSNKTLVMDYVVTEDDAKLGPICFVTPELGKWSTVGGLGVMVDELSQMLAEFGEEVVVVTPYYNWNRKGETNYLWHDNIHHKFNIEIWVGSQCHTCGIHEGTVKGVRIIFIHNPEFFPTPYPSGAKWFKVRMMALFARATLQALCSLALIPAVITTNDWFTGLVPAYAKKGFFGDTFNGTTFMHIVHNLEPSYEGRVYIDANESRLGDIHGLEEWLLIDPKWEGIVINPSRCAFIMSNTWGTVSPSYRWDLMHGGSPLGELMWKHFFPFAFPNGVPVEIRRRQLRDRCGTESHDVAKAILQERYFHRVDPKTPLFAFVGRIVEQKGVHLILKAVWELAHEFGGKIQVLVGGKVNWDDAYSASCGREMNRASGTMPQIFWSAPNEFFTDGPLVNLGADFGLMPSLFEPGGIVQHEFFVAGTPVVAFKTGGLKDTVFEFDPAARAGNGFTFESHNAGDLKAAMHRACRVFHVPDQYETLRRNAATSVIDVRTVAWAWLGDFYRNRGREDDYEKRTVREGGERTDL